ncbi:MAG: VanZ family protein [Gemmatimonadetes bacterium]|nr:VanZ family protein [Gemmatimonadota bacterium]MBT7862864.1 VanZ family protein [Gemmatimonadota bacterium]
MLCVSLSFSHALAQDLQATTRPNVLVITVDTFRPDHLGAYGYSRPTSPHIDSIAAQGVVFRKAYTTSAWTAPGLISLLTSLDAPTHGVDVRGKSIRPGVVTLADALRAGGYRAPDILFLTDIPNFHHLGFEPYSKRNQYIRNGDEILFRWLQEEAHTSTDPFFLYYHYRDLHQPYDPGEEYEPLYLQEAFGSPYNPASWARRFLAREKMDLVKREVMLPRGIIDFAPWDRGWIDALYDAQINRLDREFFGTLRGVLRDTGLSENTLIVISADHGEELLEDGLVGHVSTYKEGRLGEELVQIPLIFSGPGLPEGQQIDTRVQVIDAMPTILDLVGLPRAETMQGQSLLPLTQGQSRPAKPLFFETSAGGYTASIEHYAHRVRGVIEGDWKFIRHTPSGESTLFDLATDPQEEDDLVDEMPAVVGRMSELLDDWVRSSVPMSAPDLAPSGDLPEAHHAGPIVIELPEDGDTLRYLGADQTVALRWSGAEGATYRVLYSIGEGVYHLEGEMDVDSNAPSYGPFHAEFWNSVVLYSPFTVRVHPVGRPDLISDPVTFWLAGSDDALISLAPLQIVMSVTAFGQDLVTLTAGTILALIDLSVWLTSTVSAADVTAWALLAAILGALVWPRLQPLGEERVKAWCWMIAYVALVYSTIPIFPALWDGLRQHTGDAIRHLGTIAVVLGAVGAARQLHRRVGRSQWPSYLAFLILLAAYAVLLVRFGQFPAERLHLLEYGLMGVLLHRALTIGRAPRWSAYVVAWTCTVLIGFGDETIQWVLPQRFFELKDVGLNGISAALGLGIARLVRGT